MHWIKTAPDVSINLTGSGVASPEYLSDLNIASSEIPLGEANWYGYPPLKEWLAGKYNINPDNIAITPGASMANYAAITALGEMVDEITIETPCYEPFVRITEGVCSNGKTKSDIKLTRMERDSVNGYYIGSDFQHSTTNSSAILISNPHNPTGVFDTDENIIKLADKVAANDGYLMADEVFRSFIDGKEFSSLASLHDKIISTSSLTKVWGLYGLRIGWVIADPEFIRQIYGIMDTLHVIQPVMTEYIALHTLSKSQIANDLLTKTRTIARDNLKLVTKFLGQSNQLTYTVPDGGISMLVRFKDGRNTDQYCRRLMEDEDVLVAPGRFFDVNDGFRLSFGIEPDLLEKGMEAVVRLASLK